jgi:hypothetical protein
MSDRERVRPPGFGDDGRIEQSALVVLCICGLFLAALLVPTVGGIDGPDPDLNEPDADRPGGNASADGVDGPTIRDLLELLGIDGEGEGESVERRPACIIRLSEQPVPGTEVTVTVYREGDPVEDARVSFNGDYVGETDGDGQVTGEVPYVKNLDVDVEMPVGEDCEGTAETERVAAGGESGLSVGGSGLELAAVSGSSVGVGGASTTGAGDGDSHRLAASDRPADLDDAPRDVNQTYEVRGDIFVEYEGRPLPGETVTLRATIQGVPVEDGTVTVDGETVGRTDDDGEYELAVPNDGTNRLDVAVQRGEFGGRRTIPVALLSVRIAPRGVLAVPGGSAAVVATLGEQRASGVAVSVDGDPVGTTGMNGVVNVTLPADPGATVTVETSRQTATTTLWRVYAGTAVAVLTLLALAGGLVVTVIGGVFRYGRVPGSADGVSGLFGRVVERLVRAALWLTGGIERLLVWAGVRLRALWTRLRTFAAGLPRSLPALVRYLFRSAVSVGRDGLALAWRGLWWLLRSPLTLWRWLRRDRTTETATGTVDDRTQATAAADPDDSEPSLRERWRAFARRVVPDRWRTRTPGEVARAARERGFPAEAVADLTAVFREVEYGDRPLSEERRERARRAFETLSDDDEEVRER